MTLPEFKAWFEGYTEGLDGAPNEKQFKRIKAKVAEISGAPITQTVFLDPYRTYFDRFPQYGQPYASWSAGAVGQGVGNVVLGNLSGFGSAQTARYSAGDNQTVEWDSHAAMYAVGKAESLAA